MKKCPRRKCHIQKSRRRTNARRRRNEGKETKPSEWVVEPREKEKKKNESGLGRILRRYQKGLSFSLCFLGNDSRRYGRPAVYSWEYGKVWPMQARPCKIQQRLFVRLRRFAVHSPICLFGIQSSLLAIYLVGRRSRPRESTCLTDSPRRRTSLRKISRPPLDELLRQFAPRPEFAVV